MKEIISLTLVAIMMAGCSTAGGMYKEDDPENGEFSVERTILGVVGVAAAVAAAIAIGKSGGGGGNSYATDYDYAWDEFYNEYRQLVWACRGKQTGQFAGKEKVRLQNC